MAEKALRAEVKSVRTRHVWEAHKEKIEDQRLTPKGKRIYKRRKETVEGSFAEAKELHGHRYARLRGIAKVQEQCLLAACAQNIKEIALSRFVKNISAKQNLIFDPPATVG